ncbi:DUF4118 domain-containing protein [Mycobacterium genavense]|uniref:DUF4118 domain-containing protein n=1 Tax=Mycobacterium genavense TaxID=36812 RepID=UPI0004B1C94E|nr:DUF4118 domain-containing protein [Mycobacterium genavense]
MLLSRSPLPTAPAIAVAGGFIAVETVVLLLLKKLTGADNAFGVLYLIGVLVVATGWGAGMTAAMAVISAIAYAHFRRWPDHGPGLAQVQDWVFFVVVAVVALVAHALARTVRTRAADAEQRRQQAEASREALTALADQQAALRRVATFGGTQNAGIRNFLGGGGRTHDASR